MMAPKASVKSETWLKYDVTVENDNGFDVTLKCKTPMGEIMSPSTVKANLSIDVTFGHFDKSQGTFSCYFVQNEEVSTTTTLTVSAASPFDIAISDGTSGVWVGGTFEMTFDLGSNASGGTINDEFYKSGNVSVQYAWGDTENCEKSGYDTLKVSNDFYPNTTQDGKMESKHQALFRASEEGTYFLRADVIDAETGKESGWKTIHQATASKPGAPKINVKTEMKNTQGDENAGEFAFYPKATITMETSADIGGTIYFAESSTDSMPADSEFEKYDPEKEMSYVNLNQGKTMQRYVFAYSVGVSTTSERQKCTISLCAPIDHPALTGSAKSNQVAFGENSIRQNWTNESTETVNMTMAVMTAQVSTSNSGTTISPYQTRKRAFASIPAGLAIEWKRVGLNSGLFKETFNNLVGYVFCQISLASEPDKHSAWFMGTAGLDNNKLQESHPLIPSDSNNQAVLAALSTAEYDA